MPYNANDAVKAAQAPTGRYKDGECWTLIEDAVVGAGGKSSKVLTPRFAPNASFVWGQLITIGQLRPGDILQFSAYKWEQTVTIETTHDPKNADNPDSSDTPITPIEERGDPQHSAMVVRVVSPGVVEVVEQNKPRVTGPVQTVQLVLSARAPKTETEFLDFETSVNNTPVKIRRTTKTTTTEIVSHPPRCYRPGA